jgi:hypothetical protein
MLDTLRNILNKLFMNNRNNGHNYSSNTFGTNNATSSGQSGGQTAHTIYNNTINNHINQRSQPRKITPDQNNIFRKVVVQLSSNDSCRVQIRMNSTDQGDIIFAEQLFNMLEATRIFRPFRFSKTPSVNFNHFPGIKLGIGNTENLSNAAKLLMAGFEAANIPYSIDETWEDKSIIRILIGSSPDN